MANPILRKVDARNWSIDQCDEIRRVAPRGLATQQLVSEVAPIVSAVQSGGLSAALEFGQRFDHVRPNFENSPPNAARVPLAALERALASCDTAVLGALKTAIDRVRAVHKTQKQAATNIETMNNGRVTNRWVPIQRVGLYVPAGGAIYPSSVVMNVVPAQIAGVRSIVVTSPPQLDNHGLPHPLILATCQLLGVDEVYAIGGAQAIALLAFGSTAEQGGEVRPVDLISGPGNAYVAGAKRLVHGVVGIDSEAGPTEVTLVADSSASPRLLAADLLAQAEHDPESAAILITDDAKLIDAVDEELAAQLSHTKHQERAEQALRGQQSAAVLTNSVAQSIAIANAYASEHLHLHLVDAGARASEIDHAGAIFVGAGSPVALGDYLAGSNHVLPTGGTARFSSGLSVFSFMKLVTEVEFNPGELAALAGEIDVLARTEDLPAHADSITARESIAQ